MSTGAIGLVPKALVVVLTAMFLLSPVSSVIGQGALPDIVIQDITWSPSQPVVGDTVQFSVYFGNQGSAPTNVWSSNCYYVDGGLMDQAGVGPVDAGSMGNVNTFTWRANSAGNHIVTAVADCNNAIVESNKNNNVMQKTFNVGQNQPPPVTPSSYICNNHDNCSTLLDLSRFFNGEVRSPDEAHCGQAAIGSVINYDGTQALSLADVESWNNDPALNAWGIASGLNYFAQNNGWSLRAHVIWGWVDMNTIIYEINANRPVIIGGYRIGGLSGGHATVIIGYSFDVSSSGKLVNFQILVYDLGWITNYGYVPALVTFN